MIGALYTIFRQKDNTMKTCGQLEPILKIPVASILPEVGSFTPNGTHIREIIMIRNTSKILGNIGSTELILMSRTSANTAICNGNVKEKGSVLKRIVDAIMGGEQLSAVKAHLTLLLVVLQVLLHLRPFLRGFRVIQTVVFAAGLRKEAVAAVQSHHPDLRN